jgi:hypothetical protein
MATDTAEQLAHRFMRKITRLSSVRANSDAAYSGGALRQSDLDHIYESTFLSAISHFEAFNEDLFFSVLLGSSGIEDAAPRVVFSSRRQAESILAPSWGDRFGWAAMRPNIDRAIVLLKGGRPFTRLRFRYSELELLDKGQRVRNFIAHRSGSAERAFRELSLNRLPPRRRTPAGYLQMTVGTSNQHEVFLAEYARIALALSAIDSKAAAKQLRDEGPFQAGQRVPRGEYVCLSCGVVVSHRSNKKKLPSCPVCAGCTQCGRRKQAQFGRG